MRKFVGTLIPTLLVSIFLISSPVSAAASIKFGYTSVSKRYPCQNSQLTYKAKVVRKSDSKPVKDANVTFKVYYKTTTTSYNAGKTNSQGRASKDFKIGRATAGYKVVVKSKASKSGKTAYASTWFKPKKCS